MKTDVGRAMNIVLSLLGEANYIHKTSSKMTGVWEERSARNVKELSELQGELSNCQVIVPERLAKRLAEAGRSL